MAIGAKSVNLTITGISVVTGNDSLIHPESMETQLELEAGSITLVMGRNGTGKTYLLEKIAGLRPSQDWEMIYGEDNIWQIGKTGRRRLNRAALLAYGYAAQAPEEQLFARSVRKELEYVLKPYHLSMQDMERRMEEALQAVGWDLAWLEKDPYSMSGGERRRTALACLFAVPASWLLLDEPTAGLDAAGHELLAEQLKKRAAQGQGIILISHEYDWAAPLADTMLIVSGSGAARRCARDGILEHPQWLRQAGMPVPDWLEIAHECWKAGYPADKLWSPAGLAAGLPDLNLAGTLTNAAGIETGDRSEPLETGRREETTASASPFSGTKRTSSSKSKLPAFDPRAVWLSYILVSSAIFMQKSWSGTAWSALITLAAIAGFHIPLRRWRLPIVSFGFFMIMISLLAGTGNNASGGWWDTDAFLVSLQSLSRPWLVMLLGLGLPLSITPLRLRRSLEQLLSFRGHVPDWAQRIILTITLLLRFVPILLLEWERFSRIAVARGKTTRITLAGAAAKVKDTAIPFMLAVFRLGEQAADALESRGIGTRRPTFIRSRDWKLRDTQLVAACGLILGFLWFWTHSH
ncbi:ATP-binding cassette domain-containing protein [Paenibacillus nasutitermitis]|uniref:ABC transporter domain-containing protein n=1 Tax=Paenibacillus nasutitermitis TaxID=1652958 RepID=A0A916YY94_9BACL|nr:ATP-binding cassette domain-containing protein [Paenibacillus nasutitermitis]GGD66755.1 hypothetical protein GCM10010911_25610 [Paenibacillus nasutitermitis]